jgi:hypothetical protein
MPASLNARAICSESESLSAPADVLLLLLLDLLSIE